MNNLSKKLVLGTMIMVLALGMVFAGGEEEEEAPAELQILIYSIHYDPPSIDPQSSYAKRSELIASHLHEGLVVTDKDSQPVPGLAESWTISKDGTVYTFHLRKNAKWQDGQPITANDFLYSWRRALNPETISNYANLMYQIVNAENIVNGEADLDDLGVTVIDDYTIEIRLVASLPYMLLNLAHGVFVPLRLDIIEANPDSWAQKPETSMSSGPYYLSEYSMNERIVLTKNEYYWDAENIKLDAIHFVTIPDGSTALAAFNNGEIDGFDNIPSSEVPRLMIETDNILVTPRVRTLYMPFNTQAAPLDDVRVREALFRAVNRQELVNVMKLGRQPATGYVPFGLVSEGEDFREVGGDLGININGDLERARELLAEAGYPNGEGWPEVTITMASGYRTAVETVQEMWKKGLNIDVEIETVEGKVLSSRRKSFSFQIATGGWSAQVFHPVYFLNQFISSNKLNYAQYYNPEYDRLVEQSKIEPDPKKVLDLLHQAEALAFTEGFPIIPLYYETNTMMMKSAITGWFLDPIGRINLKYADVSGK